MNKWEFFKSSLSERSIFIVQAPCQCLAPESTHCMKFC